MIATFTAFFDELDRSYMQPIADSLSLPLDQWKFVFQFFINIPLGWFFYFAVRGRTARHLFQIIFGFII